MWDKISENTNQTFTEERLKNKKRNIIKIFAVTISIIILLGICGSIAFKAGYIPLVRFMDVKKPIGEAEEIDIDEHMNKYPKIRNFPYLDKLKYKVYGTDKSIDVVSNDYKNKLKNDGYNILYEGIAYKDEIPFKYYGFLKGFSAVGIIMTSDKNVTLDHKTIVLYSTGSVFDYRDIYNWYKTNEDFLSDIYL